MMKHVDRSSAQLPALRVPAIAMGALALGAIAIGAVAIARLAISHMAVKKARFGTVEIDDLLVRRLRVLEREPAEITASAAIPTAGSH